MYFTRQVNLHGQIPLNTPISFKRQTAEEVMEYVTNGAVWLDGNYPGWESYIDIDELDLSSLHYCVLGQTAELIMDEEVYTSSSGYDSAIQFLLEKYGMDEYITDWAKNNGFLVWNVEEQTKGEEYLIDVENDERWLMLTLGWVSLLADRGIIPTFSSELDNE